MSISNTNLFLNDLLKSFFKLLKIKLDKLSCESFLNDLKKYIKNHNLLQDLNNKGKFNFDENLNNFFDILKDIADNRRTPLLLDDNSFKYADCAKLFELCLIDNDNIYSQDENRYDFRENIITINNDVSEFLNPFGFKFKNSEHGNGTLLFYYSQFLKNFFFNYIKDNNLTVPNDKRKFNIDDNLNIFFNILINIAEERGTPLLLKDNSFYYLDVARLFELCVEEKYKRYSQDENRYDFTKITISEKKSNKDDQDNESNEDN